MEDRFYAAVEAIYDAALEPARWPEALQAITDVFDDVGTVMLWQRDDGGFGSIVSPRLELSQKEYQEAGWHLRDTRSIRAVERSLWMRRDALTERHFISDEEIAVDPFYYDFLHRHGLRWCAGVGIAPDRHVAVGLAVQRAAAKAAYSDAELDLATKLGRHVEKSLRLSIRLLDARLANIGLGEALARLGIGVFALDSLKRVVFANPAAERLLGAGLAIVNQRLVAEASSESVIMDQAFDQMIRAMPPDLTREPRPILIQNRSTERPLAVYVLPIAASGTMTEQFLTHTRAIVLVINSKAEDPADPAIVRDVLGLTLGEARVAALVGSGMTPRDAAATLRITEDSVRTILKRVFSKVGVSRQSELAVLMTKLVMR